MYGYFKKHNQKVIINAHWKPSYQITKEIRLSDRDSARPNSWNKGMFWFPQFPLFYIGRFVNFPLGKAELPFLKKYQNIPQNSLQTFWEFGQALDGEAQELMGK